MSCSEAEDLATDKGTFGGALAAALRCRGITQRNLADLLGRTAQSSVSTWTRGDTAPGPELVFEIERIVEVPPGHLSQHLGYVPAGAVPHASVAAAIEADPLLEPVHRQALLALYREFTVGQSGGS